MSRKNMSRRRLLKLMGLGVAGTTLAACQPEAVEKVVKETVVVKETIEVEGEPEVVEVEKEVTRVVEEAAAAPDEVVELRIHRNGFDEWHEAVHETFEEEHPNIKLRMEPTPGEEYWAKLRTLYAGGRLGDTFWTWQERGAFNEYTNAGMIKSIQDYVDGEGFDTSVYFQNALDLFYVEGKLMLIPEYAHPGPTGIYFNKRMCDEAGVTYVPETSAREADIYDDWPLDQFVNVLVKLTKRDDQGNVTQWGYSRGTGFHQQVSMMRRFGGDVMTPDGKEVTVDSPESIAGIKFVADLFHEHKVWPTPDIAEDTGFNMFTGNNKMATYCHGVFSAVNLRAILEDQFEHGSTLIPQHTDNGTRGLILSTGGNVVSSLSEHPDEAWEYVKFMGSHYVGTQRTLAGGAGPGARPDCWYDERIQAYDRVISGFAELIPEAVPNVVPWNFRSGEFIDAIEQNITSVWLDEVSAEEGCRNAAEAASKVLAKDPA